MAAKGVEVEIKLAVKDAATARRALRRLGFAPVRRAREHDIVLDTADQRLKLSRCLLRLRRYSRRWLLTFKGPPADDLRYKARPETEIEVRDGPRLLRILGELGYRPVFRYEKVRSTYRQGRRHAVASVDLTPIGTFLELEGPRPWIDRTARALGFSPGDYITRSYAFLYKQYCRERGREPTDMLFGS